MAIECGCTADAEDGRYVRVCDYCGTSSNSPHCVHERQAPCPECDVVPVVQPLE